MIYAHVLDAGHSLPPEHPLGGGNRQIRTTPPPLARGVIPVIAWSRCVETPGSAPHSPLKAKASAHVRDATDPWGADAMAVCGVSVTPR